MKNDVLITIHDYKDCLNNFGIKTGSFKIIVSNSACSEVTVLTILI